jgi:MoxR-like ATPase
VATQNPIELEGTYPLPEAQLDRFLFKLDVRKNTVEALEKIVNQRELGVEPRVDAILGKSHLENVIKTVRRVYLPEVVANYIARLVDATHAGEAVATKAVKFGASPRAALSLASASKARAVMNGRANASFEDVKTVAPAVLRHRMVLDYSAKIDGATTDSVIAALLEEIPFQTTGTPRPLTSAPQA